MVAPCTQCQVIHPGHVLQEFLTLCGVALHYGKFLVVKAARLVEHRIGYGNLAYVVEKGDVIVFVYLFLCVAPLPGELLRQEPCVVGNSEGMSLIHGITHINGACKGLHDLGDKEPVLLLLCHERLGLAPEGEPHDDACGDYEHRRHSHPENRALIQGAFLYYHYLSALCHLPCVLIQQL